MMLSRALFFYKFTGLFPELPLEGFQEIGIITETAFCAGIGDRLSAYQHIPGNGQPLFHDELIEGKAGKMLELVA